MRRSRHTITSLVLALLPSLLVGCGGEDDLAEASTPSSGESVPASAPTAAVAPPPAPVLEPAATFAIEAADQLTDIAISPDGSTLVAATQERLGATLTLRLYDAASGEMITSAEVEGIGLGQLYWMADGRLVSASSGLDGAWKSWEAATLTPLPDVPLDESCGDGLVDKNTGLVYSSEGMNMGDDLCRVDTSDGSILRTPVGVLQEPDRFWVCPGSGEVLVLHSPDGGDSKELVTLEGTSLAPTGSTMVVELMESVQAVGRSVWIRGRRSARLEPGAIVAPDLSPVRASGAGSYFIHSNGMDDFVFVSATDGSEIGTMPAGLNLVNFADWSLDDSWFVRLTIERMVEVYRF